MDYHCDFRCSLNKSFSRCDWEASAFYYNICMRHGERERRCRRIWANLPVAHTVKTDSRQVECLPIESQWIEVRFLTPKIQMQRKHLIHNERLQAGCSTGYSPNMLHGYIRNQRESEDWRRGEGCGFSLSQFNNELRLSGPGQPWGDPSEKD